MKRADLSPARRAWLASCKYDSGAPGQAELILLPPSPGDDGG
jgi:hypothetical protein